jgi:NAD-dependent deacetylase
VSNSSSGNTDIEACAEEIADRLGSGGTIVALTGAGISRESGVPTYRGLDGVWTKFPEEIATPQTLHREPELFWEFHDTLRRILVTAKPNAAHFALADMEAAFNGADHCEFAIITQNIDGLHQAAGSAKVIELHGSATRNFCEACGRDHNDLPSPLLQLPPRCECGAVIRPDIVLFNEGLPANALYEADRLASGADVMLVVGTSANVFPAASIPVITYERGGLIVEVNPEATALSRIAQRKLRGPAGESLPLLWEKLRPLLAIT